MATRCPSNQFANNIVTPSPCHPVALRRRQAEAFATAGRRFPACAWGACVGPTALHPRLPRHPITRALARPAATDNLPPVNGGLLRCSGRDDASLGGRCLLGEYSMRLPVVKHCDERLPWWGGGLAGDEGGGQHDLFGRAGGGDLAQQELDAEPPEGGERQVDRAERRG